MSKWHRLVGVWSSDLGLWAGSGLRTDLGPACLSMVIAVMEYDELSTRAHVDSGERRSRPQAEDPGFGNVEMCKNESAYRVISANIY